MIRRSIFYLIFPLAIMASYSCSQVTELSVINFRENIYDTCHIMFDNQVPKQFWYSMDKNLNLNRSTDSVLWVRINGAIDDRKDIPISEKSRAIRLEDLHTCKYLAFFEFKSVTNNDHWSELLDFKKFPELRYFHSDHRMTRQQLSDLLSTAKNLKGLQIKINFPVPDCICELNELRYLTITNDGNVSLPECIRKIANLKYLEINGSGIGLDEQLNQTIWNIPSLEVLRIDGGTHVDIQASVKNMNRLKQLDITSVDSISFPLEFTKLDSLELLDISWVDKKIMIPSAFSDLKRLKGIHLAQVMLTGLPIANNHSGIEFISYSEVHELDSINDMRFFNLNSLKHLWLSGIAFQTIDKIPNGIESLPNLESLELIGFGFPHDNALRRQINKYTHTSEFGGDFRRTFDYYKWLFIIGKPAKLHPKMYN